MIAMAERLEWRPPPISCSRPGRKHTDESRRRRRLEQRAPPCTSSSSSATGAALACRFGGRVRRNVRLATTCLGARGMRLMPDRDASVDEPERRRAVGRTARARSTTRSTGDSRRAKGTADVHDLQSQHQPCRCMDENSGRTCRRLARAVRPQLDVVRVQSRMHRGRHEPHARGPSRSLASRTFAANSPPNPTASAAARWHLNSDERARASSLFQATRAVSIRRCACRPRSRAADRRRAPRRGARHRRS